MKSPRVLGIMLVLVTLGMASCGGSGGMREGPTSRSGQGSGVGMRAPGFTLMSSTGQDVSLAEFRGKKPVLLYFSMGPT